MEYISQTELILNLILSAALFGVIWMVQLVAYPSLHSVPEEDFVDHHKEYMGTISWIVMPLMLAEIILGGWLVARSGVQGEWFFPFMLILMIWLTTFFIQVPQHNKLTDGKDSVIIRKLVNGNWIRTFLWTFKLVYLSFIVYEALV